jgi:hypothetical protein
MLYRLRDAVRFGLRRALQAGGRRRQLETTMDDVGVHAQLGHGGPQQAVAGVIQPAVLAHFGRARTCIFAADAAVSAFVRSGGILWSP